MYRDPHDYDSTLALLIKPLTCTGCKLYEAPLGKPSGFIVPDGDGTRGVLIVAEAGSDAEEAAGIPLVNKNGHFYFNELNRVGLERDGFMITNTIACAPPHGRLTKTSFEHSCVQHCAPNLDATIAEARAIAHANGKTFTILTLGRVAFKRVMGYEDRHPIMKLDYLSYPHWNETYRAWVIASEHPAFLSRGQTHLVPVMTFAALRAVEIATHGLTLDQPTYLLDPPPMQFAQWVSDYLTYEALHREETYLSYDIETPMKQGKDEAEIAKEDDDDYTILRCSFAYVSGNAVSVPWTAAYAPYLERLFTSPGTKVGWNNEGYDAPRVMAQMPLKGPQIDGMLAWHVLNSALPKGLGFVTPFYVPNVGMWKHLSGSEPALYNAMDADYALRNWLGIQRDLKETQLWDVFNRHVITLNKVLSYMSEQGIPLDLKARQEAEDQLAVTLKDLKGQIDLAVPEEAKKLKIYKKTPKDTTGMVATLGSVKTTECPHCNLLGVKAVHYKSIGVKKLKAGATENPCVGLKSIKVDTTVSLWAIPLEFVISNLSLQRYQGVMKHQPVMDLKKKSVTFDEKAMLRLVRKYPKDTLYPLITTFRGIQKLLSTYVGVTQESGIIKGGMPVGKDGRIHSQVTHNPSTLRTAMQNPPMQTLPRPKGPDDPATLIRNLIVPAPGHTLYARDYCGIEAVLVGYEARSRDYIRLAKMDVHSFYTAYALNELDGRVSGNDLPLLSWDDLKLATRLADIKKEFKEDRNNLYKHLVHGANFMQGPKGASEKVLLETGISYPVKLVGKVMDLYFELFPAIKKWHSQVLYQADKDGFLRNPFGYVHRFSRVYDWEKVGGTWQKSPGPAANQAIAFGPQSTAAGIIKEALLRLFFERFEEAGQYLRLIVHDELFFEVLNECLEVVDRIVKEEMEKPIIQMALPDSYEMGPFLNILTESKQGSRWGEMS